MIERIVIDGSTLNVEILPTATKHGQTKEDILSALEKCIYDETLENDQTKH